MERPRTEGGGGKGRQGRRRRRGEGVRWRRKDREKRGRQEIRGYKEVVISGRRDRGERTNAQTLGDYSTQ